MLKGACKTIAGTHERLRSRDVIAVEGDRPGIRNVVPADDVHQSRLTSAIGAYQAENFTWHNVKVDTRKSLNTGEGTGHPGHTKFV